MLRRLTRTQFRNAVRDVFGVEVNIDELDADSWNGNFAVIGAATVVTSERGVEQYQTAIESAVNAVFADATKRAQFIGCTPTGAQTDACLRGFIQTLGLRAWRRPLDGGGARPTVAVAAKASTELGGAIEGARWATVALFISPNFLYRPELGATTANGSLRLTGYEMASRLSFLVWNSLPDKMLLDQAASGMLDTADGIRAAATRLLDAAAGREAVGAFAEEYMRLDRIATQAKDPALFPSTAPRCRRRWCATCEAPGRSIAFDDRSERARPVHDHEGRRQRGARQALRPRHDRSHLDHLPDPLAARRRPARRHPRQGRVSLAVREPERGLPHACAASSCARRCMCTPIPPPPGDVDIVARRTRRRTCR